MTNFTHLGLIPQILSLSFRTLLLSSPKHIQFLLLAYFLAISVTTEMMLLRFWALHSLYSFLQYSHLPSYFRQYPLPTKAPNPLILPPFTILLPFHTLTSIFIWLKVQNPSFVTDSHNNSFCYLSPPDKTPTLLKSNPPGYASPITLGSWMWLGGRWGISTQLCLLVFFLNSWSIPQKAQ